MGGGQFLLGEAVRLAELGWSVVPAAAPVLAGGAVTCDCGRPQCASPGKHPRLPWAAYQRTRASRQELTQWWARWPGANISVVTGAVSGLIVVDVDPLHGGDDSLLDLPALPDTVRALTGSGGTHIYLRHPGGCEIPSRAGWRQGIDIRADGGQVIAPPSLHASGRRYEWEAGLDPWSIAVAEAPGWLLRELSGPAPASDVRGVFDLEEALEQPIPEGQRNVRLTQIIGALVAQHRDDPWVLPEMALAVNRRLCRPPLPDSEVEAILRSIWRRDVAVRRGEAVAEAAVPETGGLLPAVPADAAEQATPAERSEMLRAIWERLGVRSGAVTRVVGYAVGDEHDWWLEFADGGRVRLGGDLFSWSAVFRALANGRGDVIAQLKPAAWRAAMAQVAALAERMVAAEPGAEMIDGWVMALAASRGVVDGDDIGMRRRALEALREGAVVAASHGGVRCLWVSLGRLLAWAELHMGERVQPRTAAVWMRNAGWESAWFTADGRSWRAWRRPVREGDPV